VPIGNDIIVVADLNDNSRARFFDLSRIGFWVSKFLFATIVSIGYRFILDRFDMNDGRCHQSNDTSQERMLTLYQFYFLCDLRILIVSLLCAIGKVAGGVD